MVSLIVGDANREFLSQVGEDLPKYTDIDIMDKLNRTKNTSTEGVDEAAYVGTIPTSGTEVIDKLTGGYPGSPSPAKRMKTFVPPDMETISYPVLARFITNLWVNLNHSAEVIVGDQASISILNSKI